MTRSVLMSWNPPAETGPALYVSTTGSDSAPNDGSITKPFRTIQKAANTVAAGVTVHVAPGIYREAISMSRSGTATSRIHYISDVRWGATVSPPTTNGGNIWSISGSYIDIDGFDVDGTANPYYRAGISTSGTYNKIYNCNIHHIIATNPDAETLGGAGIRISGSSYSTSLNSEIYNNIVHHIGDPTHQYRTFVALIQAIYVANPNVEVFNNIVYDTEKKCIQLYHNPNNVVVSNNLLFKSYDSAIVIGGDSTHTALNNIIQNNIVIDCVRAFQQNADANSNSATNVWRNNISWSNDSHGTPWINSSGLITTDPKLKNYQVDGSGDYHLLSGSPAINSGITALSPTFDYDYVTRPQGSGIDRGPYEFV